MLGLQNYVVWDAFYLLLYMLHSSLLKNFHHHQSRLPLPNHNWTNITKVMCLISCFHLLHIEALNFTHMAKTFKLSLLEFLQWLYSHFYPFLVLIYIQRICFSKMPENRGKLVSNVCIVRCVHPVINLILTGNIGNTNRRRREWQGVVYSVIVLSTENTNI